MMTTPEKLRHASEGLLFQSESDHPFDAVMLGKPEDISSALRQLCSVEDDAPVEKTTLQHLFRRMIHPYEGASEELIQKAQRFSELAEVLEKELKELKVYRVGHTQVDIFIIGYMDNGMLGGLHTRSIET